MYSNTEICILRKFFCCFMAVFSGCVTLYPKNCNKNKETIFYRDGWRVTRDRCLVASDIFRKYQTLQHSQFSILNSQLSIVNCQLFLPQRAQSAIIQHVFFVFLCDYFVFLVVKNSFKKNITQSYTENHKVTQRKPRISLTINNQ